MSTDDFDFYLGGEPMNQDLSMQKLQDLFTFPFKDPKWGQKLLIATGLALGSILLMVTIVFWIVPLAFLYGYFAALIRTIVVEEREPNLPEWDHWGELFVEGLKITLVGLVYVLPVIFLFFAGYGFLFAIPFFSELSGAGNRTIMEVIMPLIATSGFMIAFGLAMLLSLVIGAILPVVTTHVVVKGDFTAAFRVPEWWAIYRANLGGFLVSYVVIFGLSMVASFVVSLFYYTIILCCLVPLLMAAISAYLIVVSGAIFGDAYAVGIVRLGNLDEQGLADQAESIIETSEEDAG
jgi:hypothetical protein